MEIKTAKESTSDFNYMRQAELDLMFRQNYESDIRQAVQSMKDLNVDPLRIRRFVCTVMSLKSRYYGRIPTEDTA